ncbi:MAG: Gfo/Idh/MocA family oxidoreductase [Alphaproteobacteria bacterium]|nr:Gfo/Idh/MocA family oxidoreductase [Alphaproteobacteria bacterium]MDP6515639.1 Gfo/Idh/MocA family oxidoreductase [Alphaproteobacteria bacterium]
MEPVRWGVLSTAKIGTEKVIPAMQRGTLCRIEAIASRNQARASEAAARLGIPRTHDSYEALLADPEIEAIYNPLPNHMHVAWTARAADAGKHVLCEKPLAMTAAEAETLIAARDRAGVRIEEAFMVRNNPQWLWAREQVRSGRIGRLRAIQGCLTYRNMDPDNIRNRVEVGGGGLYDIGSYPITMSRFVLDAEPTRAVALMERDPDFATDRLTSAMLDFGDAQASFTCATQLARFQTMQLLGTEGWLHVELPFVMEPDRDCRILIGDGTFPGALAASEQRFSAVDQYTLQGDGFSERVRTGAPSPFPLENAVRNMAVIDALFRSAANGGWEAV